jgi:hypothetical protein
LACNSESSGFNVMKYYHYVSETKLQMLLQQIEEDSGKVITELKADLKLLASTRTTERNQNRYAALEKVSDFILTFGNVGTVDEPAEYVFDTLDLKWGPYGITRVGPNPLVFFAGATDQTVVGLGGSRKHVIGEEGTGIAGSASGTPLFARYLLEALELSTENATLYETLKANTAHRSQGFAPDNQEYIDLTAFSAYEMKGPSERLEFLAKTLLQGQLSEDGFWKSKGLAGKRVLMATPLYVARVDVPKELETKED